jgi:hypothetical protein
MYRCMWSEYILRFYVLMTVFNPTPILESYVIEIRFNIILFTIRHSKLCH